MVYADESGEVAQFKEHAKAQWDAIDAIVTCAIHHISAAEACVEALEAQLLEAGARVAALKAHRALQAQLVEAGGRVAALEPQLEKARARLAALEEHWEALDATTTRMIQDAMAMEARGSEGAREAQAQAAHQFSAHDGRAWRHRHADQKPPG